MSLKASSRIPYRKMKKSVGASIHPCLTPFVIANVSDSVPAFLSLNIIPVYQTEDHNLLCSGLKVSRTASQAQPLG